MLALASYRSLTNQILVFGTLDLNRFQSKFQQYAGSSLASSVLLCAATSHCSALMGRACSASATADAVSQFGLLIPRERRKAEKLSREKECPIELTSTERRSDEFDPPLINHPVEVCGEADLR